MPQGHLRVSAPFAFGQTWLAPMAAELTRRYPAVSVETLLGPGLPDLVAEGIDVAIRPAVSLPDSSLVLRRFGTVTLGLYASPSTLEGGGVQAVDEIEAHPFVAFQARHGQADLLLQGGKAPRALRLRAAVSGDDYAFVLQALLAGAGVGVLPDILADPSVREGRLRRVLSPWHAGRAGLHLLIPRSRLLSARVRAFEALVFEIFGDR